jgi:hypothetical protein
MLSRGKLCLGVKFERTCLVRETNTKFQFHPTGIELFDPDLIEQKQF